MPCKSMASAGRVRELTGQKPLGPCRNNRELTLAAWGNVLAAAIFVFKLQFTKSVQEIGTLEKQRAL